MVLARERGLQMLRAGKIAESIPLLQEALEEDSTDLQTYLALGLAFSRQGEFDRAAETLEAAVSIAPTSAQAHYNLGVAYHRLHNLTLAKEEYLRALGLDPTYTPAKTALDLLLREQADVGHEHETSDSADG